MEEFNNAVAVTVIGIVLLSLGSLFLRGKWVSIVLGLVLWLLGGSMVLFSVYQAFVVGNKIGCY